MTTRIIILSIGLVIGAALLAGPVAAQSANCAPHAVVLEQLADRYGESRQTIAIGANNSVVETWANPDSGSWTITITAPGGPTCLVASGHAFELVAEPLPNTDQGA
jgi:cation diffusion facilitator CzcD-associated flavoprotein CzcO